MSSKDAADPTDAGSESTERAEIPDVPDWEDEYVDRVADRLMYNYDLEKDRTIDGIEFTLFGEMNLESKKHMFHPVLSFAHHYSEEYLFIQKLDHVRVDTLEQLAELGHDLADEWIVPNEDHYSTDFTFAVVASSIPDDVRTFVSGFSDRTLLKFGYYGHYEINVVVVAPDEEDLVASPEATVEQAFRLWTPIEKKEPGLLGLIARRFQL